MEFSSYFLSGIPASGQLHISLACSQLANSLKCVALITYPAFVQEGCCVVVFVVFFSWSSAYFYILSLTFATSTKGVGGSIKQRMQ